jgi:hypothetical protein
MGLYNAVSLKRLIPCPRCGHDGDIEVQFSYGDTYLLHYKLGDTIRWSGGDTDVGKPDLGAVEILGYPEWCPVCGLDVEGDYALTGDPDQHMAEYVLTVQDGRITGYRQATAADVERTEWASSADERHSGPGRGAGL